MRRLTSRSPSGRPSISARPEVGNTSCISSFSVVVLPAPFGPRKPKTSPALDVERQAIERAIGPLSPEADGVVFRQLVSGKRAARHFGVACCSS